MKSLLFHLHKLPYSSTTQEEDIETILFAGAYGYQVTVIFSSYGIMQLNATQSPMNGQKNISNLIMAFPNFDITNIYVCQEDLAEYKLAIENLAVQAELISRNQIIKLMQQFDIVMNF